MNSIKEYWNKYKREIISGLVYFLLIPFVISLLLVEVFEVIRCILSSLSLNPDVDGNFHFFGVIFSKLWLFTWIACEFGALGWVLYLKLDNNPKRKAKRGRNIDHVARLRSDTNFKRVGYNGKLGDPHKRPGVVVASKGSKIPWRRKTDMFVAVDEKNHVMGLGPTGTGKSQVWIINSIIHNLSTIDDVEKVYNEKTKKVEEKIIKKIAPMIIVTDVKGELYEETHGYANEMGYKIHCFDTNTGGAAGPSLSFNPLYYLHKYHLEAKRLEEEGNVDRATETRRNLKETMGDVISVVLNVAGDSKSEAFWKENNVQLTAGLIYLMFDLYDGKYFKEISDISFATAFELVQNKTKLVELSKKYGKSEGFGLFMKESAKTIENDPNDKTQIGILKGVSAKIQIFETYRDKTSRDELHLIDQNEKNILYLKVPDHRDGSYKIVALLIQLLYTNTVDEANERRGEKRAIRDIKVIWDELTNFPQVPSLTNMIRMSRSRGFQFLFAIQDQASLQSQYSKEEAITIMENCKTKMALRVGLEDAKYFSSIAGDRKKAANISYNNEKGKRPNYSISEDYKEVLRPSEIQDFKIIGTYADYSESFVVTPDTKVLAKNIPWFSVKGHLTSACRKYNYNVVDTYYGPGTKIWREVEKDFKNKKGVKEFNMKQEKANFIEDLWLKNPKKPDDIETERWMEQKWKKHKKKLLEENGVIIHSKDIKKEIRKRLDKQGYAKIGGTTKEDVFAEMSDIELQGYSTNIKDIADYIFNNYKKELPEIMKKYNLESIYSRKINSPYTGNKGTVRFIEEGFEGLSILVKRAIKDEVLVKHGKSTVLYKKWKQLENKFGFLIEDNIE